MRKRVRPFLREVEKPGRYTGGEPNEVQADPNPDTFRMALCYPDLYEIGMSHHGLSLLYHRVNETESCSAERCFAPWPDMAERLTALDIPLYALESGTPLREFDLVGFSLQHELLYTNVLQMLRLAGIPTRSEDRGPEDPLLLAGGSGALTPEPMAGVFDLFLTGDGEEALPALLVRLGELKRTGTSRSEMLETVAREFPFLYVPAFYQPEYDATGRFKGMKILNPSGRTSIQAAVTGDLEDYPIPRAPVVPVVRCVHDRITLEIMRGCTRGCRFCQAGMTKRPLRTRSPETLLKAAQEIYRNTGHDEISICSLSSADYPALNSLVDCFNQAFEPLRVGLSLPSLRVGKNLRTVPGLTAAVRKAGLTLAPEAATDRLRRQMNKAVTNEDLEAGALKAFEAGWRRVKLYFMIGLPGETEEDVRAIADLALRIANLRRQLGQGPAQVTVSVSTFVPKAHTPFQWCPMARPEEIRIKHRLLFQQNLPKHIRFKLHNPEMSYVEAMLARGDRRLLAAIEKAQALGAGFDAWKEKFSYSAWKRAFEETGINADEILFRERESAEAFSWGMIETGPSKEFLREEYERAGRGELTPYCETDGCQQCGVDPKACAILKKSRREDEPTPEVKP